MKEDERVMTCCGSEDQKCYHCQLMYNYIELQQRGYNKIADLSQVNHLTPVVGIPCQFTELEPFTDASRKWPTLPKVPSNDTEQARKMYAEDLRKCADELEESTKHDVPDPAREAKLDAIEQYIKRNYFGIPPEVTSLGRVFNATVAGRGTVAVAEISSEEFGIVVESPRRLVAYMCNAYMLDIFNAVKLPDRTRKAMQDVLDAVANLAPAILGEVKYPRLGFNSLRICVMLTCIKLLPAAYRQLLLEDSKLSRIANEWKAFHNNLQGSTSIDNVVQIMLDSWIWAAHSVEDVQRFHSALSVPTMPAKELLNCSSIVQNYWCHRIEIYSKVLKWRDEVNSR